MTSSIKSFNNDVSIGSGYKHFYILKDHNLYVYGSNNDGQLGLGDYNDRYNFCKVNIPNVSKVASGRQHLVILTRDGHVYTTGQNIVGQLGLGDKNDRNYPSQVNLSNIIDIASGADFTLAITSDGKIYGWGYNSPGELGLGHFNDVFTPQRLNIDNVEKVFCGKYYMYILDNSGKLYGAGINNCFQSGIKSAAKTENLKEFPLSDVINVSCGDQHTIFSTKSGQLFGSGYNNYKQLGSLESNIVTLEKLDISDIGEITNVICGSNQTFIITKDGKISLWSNLNKLNDTISEINSNDKINKVSDIHFTQDNYIQNKNFILATQDGKIYMQDTASGSKYQNLTEVVF